MKKIYVEELSGRKNHIGDYESDNKTFTANRNRSSHFMRKYKGWGLDKSVLVKLAGKDAYVVIIDRESETRYETTAKYFLKNGTENTFKGHLPQVFLNEFSFDVKTEVKPNANTKSDKKLYK